MKKNIHPKFYNVISKCQTCGYKHEMKSTIQEMSIDTCSQCHSFYTGNSHLTKSTGRVERFNKIMSNKIQKPN